MSVRALTGLVLVTGLLLAPFRADARQAPQRLYVPTASGLGSARQLSLGGAFVAVADGGAFTANHASFAQPSRWLGKDFDAFFALQLSSSFGGGRDLDNDGVVDRDGARHLLLGAGMRWRRFGFGLYARNASICLGAACPQNGPVDGQYIHGGLSAALSFLDGQLVGAVGLHSVSAVLRPHVGSWSGGGVGLDVLWRPTGEPFRLGATFRPLSIASPEPRLLDGPLPEGTPPRPSRVVFPATLSVGVAAKLDKGREGLNVPRERDDDPTATVAAHQLARDVFRHRRELPPGRLLATAQIDVVFGVRGAAALHHFMAQDVAPVPMGEDLLVTPRFGVEHVTVPGRLRLRGGTWLEPSPVKGVPPRLHATGGFDLFLFHFVFDWGLTGAVDIAPRARQGGLSFGVWG